MLQESEMWEDASGIRISGTRILGIRILGIRIYRDKGLGLGMAVVLLIPCIYRDRGLIGVEEECAESKMQK